MCGADGQRTTSGCRSVVGQLGRLPELSEDETLVFPAAAACLYCLFLASTLRLPGAQNIPRLANLLSSPLAAVGSSPPSSAQVHSQRVPPFQYGVLCLRLAESPPPPDPNTFSFDVHPSFRAPTADTRPRLRRALRPSPLPYPKDALHLVRAPPPRPAWPLSRRPDGARATRAARVSRLPSAARAGARRAARRRRLPQWPRPPPRGLWGAA